MTPFVQELISFISLMLGVIVLTAWIMWLLLRPSGDTKVKDFAEESARDGLTQCVMENNELKNTVIRLEREIKVLMAAGYGRKKEDEEEGGAGTKDEGSGHEAKVEGERGKGKEENLKIKDEGLRAKDEGSGHEKKTVAGGAVSNRLKASAVKAEEQPVESKGIRAKAPEKPVQKPTGSVQAASAAEAEAKRVIDEAEKKKIAEYMANVEKTQERHKKEVEALAAKAEKAEKVEYPDNNLKKIKGIGPYLEAKLKKSGITSFQQIAELNEKDIKRIADEIGSFPRRIKREAWAEQAEKLLGKG